jgi:hypothetical protein
MRKAAIIIFFITIVVFSGKILAAQENSHFSAALKLVEMTFNKEAVYQQFIYFGLLPAKERYENNPKTKKYSEILVGVVREVLDEYFKDPETQKNLKVTYASIYTEEFTEKELREMIEFYKTDTGKKVLQKLPSVMEKGRRKEAELASGLSSPKYEEMLIKKLDELQEKGLLPKEF